MVQSRRSAVALIAVVAFAVAFVAVEAHGFKFAVGNSLGNDIDVINTKSNRVTNLVKSTAGLISPDNMLRIPGKDRFIVSSGEELSNSALMIVDSNTGRVIGRFDDGTLTLLPSLASPSHTILAVGDVWRLAVALFVIRAI